MVIIVYCLYTSVIFLVIMENEWTDKRAITITKWMLTCKQYLDFHQTEKIINQDKIRRLLIANISLSGMAIVLNGFVFLNDATVIVGSICAATINAIIAGMQVYQRFECHETKLSLHKTAIKAYKRLNHKINQELTLPVSERTDCNQFMRNISLQLLDYEDDFEQPILSLATVSMSVLSNDEIKDDVKSMKSIESLESELSINSDDDSIAGFTDDQQARFGMFIRRASTRQQEQQHTLNYQLKRLGHK